MIQGISVRARASRGLDLRHQIERFGRAATCALEARGGRHHAEPIVRVGRAILDRNPGLAALVDRRPLAPELDQAQDGGPRATSGAQARRVAERSSPGAWPHGFFQAFRRLDHTLAKHISWVQTFDKPALVPDDDFAATEGDALVNTVTATPAEAASAKAADGLIEVRLTAIRYAARDTNLFEFSRSTASRCPPTSPARISTCICRTGSCGTIR